jgi:hypothetical protein
MNLMTPGSRPTSEQKSGLAELLKKHKKNMDFVGEAEVTAAKSAAKDDLISVFFIATSKGGVYIFDPSSEQINRIFQVCLGIQSMINYKCLSNLYVHINSRQTVRLGKFWVCQIGFPSLQLPKE